MTSAAALPIGPISLSSDKDCGYRRASQDVRVADIFISYTRTDGERHSVPGDLESILGVACHAPPEDDQRAQQVHVRWPSFAKTSVEPMALTSANEQSVPAARKCARSPSCQAARARVRAACRRRRASAPPSA